MFFLRISVLYFFSELVFSSPFCLSENSCKCVLPDNSGVINLYSVGLKKYARFSEILYNISCLETYSYNPCYGFDSSDKHTETDPAHIPCINAAACVKGFGESSGKLPEEHAIGLQNTAVFDKTDTKISINYAIPGVTRKLRVFLECNNNIDTHELAMVSSECSSGTADIELRLTSKCACPNGCGGAASDDPSPGLSTGSKLLISFFTILLAYLLIGIVWNYCNGAKGSELVPNLEFWNDLPTLIMEGVAFTCSCCGRQSTYGEV